MNQASATEMYAASWDYETCWYLKRSGEAPEAGHFLARTIEEAREQLAAVMDSIDALTTGWAHIIDQVENRVLARYLGSPAQIVGEVTGTHFHTV